eukprot:PLAT11455.3.p1 GENE.PLAT11455.3~~PLAT11455.3.p1  ORF type:complete len:665 (+),score=77.42 PLAT11455.3:111-2105(+)
MLCFDAAVLSSIYPQSFLGDGIAGSVATFILFTATSWLVLRALYDALGTSKFAIQPARANRCTILVALAAVACMFAVGFAVTRSLAGLIGLAASILAFLVCCFALVGCWCNWSTIQQQRRGQTWYKVCTGLSVVVISFAAGATGLLRPAAVAFIPFWLLCLAAVRMMMLELKLHYSRDERKAHWGKITPVLLILLPIASSTVMLAVHMDCPSCALPMSTVVAPTIASSAIICLFYAYQVVRHVRDVQSERCWIARSMIMTRSGWLSLLLHRFKRQLRPCEGVVPLARYLMNQLTSAKLCDTAFRLDDGTEMPAHRALLAKRFKQGVEVPMEVHGIAASVFEAVLHIAYSNGFQPCFEDEEWNERVLVVAAEYLVPNACNAARQCLNRFLTDYKLALLARERQIHGLMASQQSDKALELVEKGQPPCPPLRAPKLSKGVLASLRSSGLASDVKLVVGSRCLQLHRLVLCRCDYLRALLTGGMAESAAVAAEQEVELHEVDEDAVELLVAFLYTGGITKGEATVQQLAAALQLADEWAMLPLVKQDILVELADRLTADSAIELYAYACELGLTEFADCCEQLIALEWPTSTSQPGWRQLPQASRQVLRTAHEEARWELASATPGGEQAADVPMHLLELRASNSFFATLLPGSIWNMLHSVACCFSR